MIITRNMAGKADAGSNIFSRNRQNLYSRATVEMIRQALNEPGQQRYYAGKNLIIKVSGLLTGSSRKMSYAN